MADNTTPKSRIESVKKYLAKGKKYIVTSAINSQLSRNLESDHRKSFLKDEKYIISNDNFASAIKEARQQLNFTNSLPIPKKDQTSWIIRRISKGAAKSLFEKDGKMYHNVFDNAVRQVLTTANLSQEWESYVGECIVNGRAVGYKHSFNVPDTIRVEDINEAGELVIRLKPGLRHEDYSKSWKVFAGYLGTGKRLNKSYSNQERNLRMLADKESGMSYKEITEKYFPGQDPLNNFDAVKKAISRERKRQNRDK